MFQPLLMPALVFGLLLFAVPESTSLPEEFKTQIFYLIVLSTLLIPMITIIGLRLSGMVKSLHLPQKQDRLVPFIITNIYFILTTYFLYQKSELDPILWKGMAVISFSVLALTIVTLFWKMSAHMTGLGGLLGVILIMSKLFPTFNELYPLLLTIVLSGAVASSRLYLDAHKPLEVYAGFLSGFLICWFGFSWIWA
ncbi:PA-phosphatase [Algoriphagus mannitolivorans]|uniref:PA-phosphatase n=1 Tax=Algoriphagus mannitolivorans TaxID=226504 RepID=UPI001FDECB4E|nr:PA-phosphatase [Algoriphagus mannitolivorans]